jgi:1-acyl-sn-glycerol-3-phosphate acyltransferase
MENRWVTSIRFGARMAAFIAGTLVFWACMEIDYWLQRSTPRLDLTNKWVVRWARTLMAIFGIRVEADGPFVSEGRVYPGRDARGVGRIFVMNHRSGVDIPVIFTLAAAHVISRHDLAKWPLIGGGARRIGTLFVDRASRRSGAGVLQQVARALKSGEGIAMFPEGTAFPGDEVREFKPGAFNAAMRAGAEVIPMGIAYGDPAAYYANESFMAHMKRIAGMRRLRVRVEIGEPLSPADCSSQELKERARDAVERLVARARQQLEAAPAPARPLALAAQAP